VNYAPQRGLWHMGVAQKGLLNTKGELCSAKGFVTHGSSAKGIVDHEGWIMCHKGICDTWE